MYDWKFAKGGEIPYSNCRCRPQAIVEVEEVESYSQDERFKVTGKFIKMYKKFRIDRVIFNNPATIVFWSDGTKTVVKANDETFDKEKGLAMAISKKFFGNKGNYYNWFKKFCTSEKTKMNERLWNDIKNRSKSEE